MVRTVESPLMADPHPHFSLFARFVRPAVLLAGCSVLLPSGLGQQERHGRGYKAPPPTATVVVTVEKAANEKPLANASVIFRAVSNEVVSGNLEMKTDPDGRASIDLLEVGSHITVQVIAGGYATYASDFDLTSDGKQILVKLRRPRAQVSVYEENADRPAETHPGIQERPAAVPTSVAPAQPSATGPLKTTPPVPTPAIAPGSSTAPAAPSAPATSGSPQ